MKATRIFPIALIIMNLGAGVVYFMLDRDVRRLIYWVSAAILTASVTF